MEISLEPLIFPATDNLLTFPLEMTTTLTSQSLKGYYPCISTQLLSFFLICSCHCISRLCLSTAHPMNNGTSYLSFNRCACMATFIRPMNWSNFFLISDVDICSQLFVDNFSRMLSFTTPASLRQQHFIGTFFNPNAMHTYFYWQPFLSRAHSQGAEMRFQDPLSQSSSYCIFSS